jgi:hypothetical protein
MGGVISSIAKVSLGMVIATLLTPDDALAQQVSGCEPCGMNGSAVFNRNSNNLSEGRASFITGENNSVDKTPFSSLNGLNNKTMEGTSIITFPGSEPFENRVEASLLFAEGSDIELGSEIPSDFFFRRLSICKR